MFKLLLAIQLFLIGSIYGTTLQSVIDEQVNKGVEKVVVPSGKYREKPIKGTHLTLKNLNNIEIDFSGVELICTETTRALDIANCSNLTITGLTIDYDPLPFTQGKITASAADGTWFDVELIKGYPKLIELVSKKIEIFDPKTKQLRNKTYFSPTIKQLDNGLLRIHKKGSRLNLDTPELIGDVIVFDYRYTPNKYYKAHAIFSADCENVTFNKVTLFASNCFGFLEIYCNNSSFLGCVVDRRSPETDLKKRGFPRMRSITADAFHSKYAEVGPKIVDCKAQFHGDDCVNISGVSHLIMKSDGKKLRVLDKDNSLPKQIKVGQHVELISVTGRRLEDATIKSITSLGTITSEERLFVDQLKMANRLKPKMKHIYEISLDRPVNLQQGSVISSIHGQGFLIKNNDFGNNRSRGIITKSRHGKIVGNSFAGCWMPAIRIGPDMWWLENGATKNLEISQNTFKNCRSIAIAVFAMNEKGDVPENYHEKVLVTDNEIINSPKPGILVTSTSELNLKNNDLSLQDKKIARYQKIKLKENSDVILIKSSLVK